MRELYGLFREEEYYDELPFLKDDYPEIYNKLKEFFPDWLEEEDYGEGRVWIADTLKDAKKVVRDCDDGNTDFLVVGDKTDLGNFILYPPYAPEWHGDFLIIPKNLEEEIDDYIARKETYNKIAGSSVNLSSKNRQRLVKLASKIELMKKEDLSKYDTDNYGDEFDKKYNKYKNTEKVRYFRYARDLMKSIYYKLKNKLNDTLKYHAGYPFSGGHFKKVGAFYPMLSWQLPWLNDRNIYIHLTFAEKVGQEPVKLVLQDGNYFDTPPFYIDICDYKDFSISNFYKAYKDFYDTYYQPVMKTEESFEHFIEEDK